MKLGHKKLVFSSTQQIKKFLHYRILQSRGCFLVYWACYARLTRLIAIKYFVQSKIINVNCYFCCSHSGLFFHNKFLFSDEAWRLLPGETSKYIGEKTSLRVLLVKHQKRNTEFYLSSILVSQKMFCTPFTVDIHLLRHQFFVSLQPTFY